MIRMWTYLLEATVQFTALSHGELFSTKRYLLAWWLLVIRSDVAGVNFIKETDFIGFHEQLWYESILH